MRTPILELTWAAVAKKVRARFFVFLLLFGSLTLTSNSNTAHSVSPCAPVQYTIGGYIVDSFTSNTTCTWTPPIGVTRVDVLVLGGGGGGGWNSGSGGSGGGVIQVNNFDVTQSVSVTVGNGGAGETSADTSSASGGASTFGSITANGGLPGLPFDATCYPTASPGTVNGYGAGGIGSTIAHTNTGCGRATFAQANGGAGGDGFASNISGTNYYYGGGGGGGGWSGAGNPFGGNGGLSGGGKGSDGSAVGLDGAAYSGGGGGASGASGYAGGRGGSGVVVLRFLAGSGDFTTGKNGSATYRSTFNFIVTVQAASTVTFYANNKKIPGCLKVATSGTNPITASCNMKPSLHGSIVVTAVVAPNLSPSSTVKLSAGTISVSKRGNTR